MKPLLNLMLTLSLCGHLLGLAFIKPIMGEGSLKLKGLKIFFLGSLLSQDEVNIKKDNYSFFKTEPDSDKRIFLNLRMSWLQPAYRNMEFLEFKFRRPLFDLSIFNQRQIPYFQPQACFLKKEASLIFSPYIPYSFLLYFKDRQKAYLEFLFYISKEGRLNSINRRISSGNLEIDLLVMRHITRSLYLIRNSFPSESSQIVKVEFSR